MTNIFQIFLWTSYLYHKDISEDFVKNILKGTSFSAIKSM